MIRSALVLVSIVLLGAVPVAVVHAVGDTPKRAAAADTNKHPCHDDVQKFCKDVQLAGGRIQQCLTKHEAELSKACRDSRQQAKTRADKLLKVCDADIKKFCDEVQPGGGRVTRCLKAKESQLTAACRAEFPTGRKAANSSEQ
jgi:hypothetical protein